MRRLPRFSPTHRSRVQTLLFATLLLVAMALLAQLSTRHAYRSDWSYGARNSLSEPSRAVIARLDRGRVAIEAFTRPDGAVADALRELVGRYLHAGAPVDLTFVNPDLAPERVRALGIAVDGALRVAYDGRAETLHSPDEASLSNLLLRLVRGGERRILFLGGHGERRADGQANFDMGRFGAALAREGLQFTTLNLGQSPSVPADAALLVVASPQVALLAGEVAEIGRHVEAGGNLLWLDEPGAASGLEPVAEQLGITRLPGTVVDTATRAYGIDDPSFAVVSAYPRHAASEGLGTVTLFPQAAALDVVPHDGWQATRLLVTQPAAWSETGPRDGTIRHDAALGERSGPLTLGAVLSRPRPGTGGEQRIAVIGDGDFLANAFLGNGGNLALGLRLVNWLVHDDGLIDIPPRSAPDRHLELGRVASMVIGLGFLIVVPIALLSGGLLQWRRRRRG